MMIRDWPGDGWGDRGDSGALGWLPSGVTRQLQASLMGPALALLVASSVAWT